MKRIMKKDKDTNEMVPDPNYKGVYINKLANGTVSFYIGYRDIDDKVKKERVGISPKMNKTKARDKLQEKRASIREQREALKDGNLIPPVNNKKDKKLYTLNKLADFYFEDNKKIKTIKSVKMKYDYHVRNEAFANKLIQLITREDLIDFLERKMAQRADKRQFSQGSKSIKEKEFEEFENNKKTIERLKKRIDKKGKKDIWREENKIRYLEKKNLLIETRNDEKLSKNILGDSSKTEDEKRYILGLLSHKTIKEILNSCKTIINHATYEKELAIRNPFEISKKDKKLYIKVDNIRDRFLTKVELDLFVKEVKYISRTFSKHKNIYLMLLLALSSGARQSTILNIKIGDIDLENGFLNLRNYKADKSYISFISTPILKEELIKMINNRDDQDDYLFINYTQKRPYRYPRILADILDYTVNYKRPYFKWLSMKDIRNTTASHLAINGVPLQYIRDVLNHADIATTQRYAHLSEDSGKEALTDMMSSFGL